MLDALVDLGSIKVTGKKPNLSLTVSSSFTISPPPLWPITLTADELSRASSSGNIWVSKAGSCQIEVLTLVNDEPPDFAFEPSTVAAIVSLASECPIWKHIGLELRADHTSNARPNQGLSQSSFFLHHPDLSSEMIAPSDVPSARFQSLRCEVNYCIRLPWTKPDETRQQPTAEPLISNQDVPQTHPCHTYGLRGNLRRTKKASVAQEEIDRALINPPSSSHPKSEPTPDDPLPEGMGSLEPEAMIEEMASLLDFAFRKLIGVKKAAPGKKMFKTTPSPSLIDIAPAVWNLQYLQARISDCNSLDCLDQFKHNDSLVDMGSYTLMAEHGLYSEMAEEVLNDPAFFETHGWPHSNESYEMGDGELSSDDGTNGLEADYFYTDGHGNVYPVETRAVLEADEIEWPSTPQPLELFGFNHDAEEVELYADENTTQPFIMYHEVQQWPIASGVPVHTQDAAGQTWSRSGPDESLWFGRSAGT
ncbi:hypothetical protein BT67DRAFT_383879 [Trichocladium antarcticum]|uniref:Uncharacterized protein n=1 Tax=Trichocladium antarcticum TaxID=1450529 RepID=A0AAN6UHR6_9PEZI|nr:hypothetical protein BT67DRAFT_383879 [Trichocladium antarcticum]